MIIIVLRIFFLFLGVAMAFGFGGLVVFSLAWVFSQRDNGWKS
jgi:hypothetical protein